MFNGGDGFSVDGHFTITDFTEHAEDGHPESVETITTDLSCEYRSSERKINDVSTQSMVATTLMVTDSSGEEVVSFDNCAGATVELAVGTYNYTYAYAYAWTCTCAYARAWEGTTHH